MSELLSGLLGAVLGTVALVASVVLAESYKRHCDRRATALAIAGELFAILDMTSRRGHVTSFEAIKKTLQGGMNVNIPNVVGVGLEGKLDPVAEAHLDRLGLLAENRLPERIAQFYTNVRGIRIDIVNLSRGVFDDDLQKKAGLIQEDLVIWNTTRQLADELYAELRKIGEEPWWLERKCMEIKNLATRFVNFIRGQK